MLSLRSSPTTVRVRQPREARRIAAQPGAGLEDRPLVGQERGEAVLVTEPEPLDVPAVLRRDALPDLLLVDARPLGRERVESPGLVAERPRVGGHEARDAVADREAVPVGARELRGLARVAVRLERMRVDGADQEIEEAGLHGQRGGTGATRTVARGRPVRRKRSHGPGR